MLKKSIAFMMTLLIAFSLFFTSAVMADGETVPFDLGVLHCRYAILVDASDPTTALYGIEKNADVQCATGSTIKVLTCMIAIESGRLDEYVTISPAAVDFSAKNSLMGLKEGEHWTLRDLLYGLMLPSGNDAAVAIAEHIAGSTNEFAKLMNKKAEELGMKNSHFITVNGRDSKSHYSTARDMALLTAYALENEEFCKIVGTGRYSCTDEKGRHTIDLINTNRLIQDQVAADGSYTPISCLYPSAIGVKTGDTNNAGKCFIGAAKRGGTTLIAVLLGGTLDDEYYQKNWLNMHDKQKDPYNAQRFEDAIACFDYAFRQMSVLLTVQDLVNAGMPVSFRDVQVINYSPSDENEGKIDVKVEIDTSVEIQLMKPFYEELMPRISSAYTVRMSDPLYAPVTEGDTVGTITYDFQIDGMSPTYNLIATRSVKEGIVATSPILVGDSGSTELIGAPGSGTAEGYAAGTGGLIGEAINKDGEIVAPVEKEKSLGSTVLTIALIVVGIALVLLIVLLIRAKILRERRRRERIARKKRQRELMARRQMYDRYEK